VSLFSIPDVVGMNLCIWVLLNGEVSISCHEVAVQGAALALGLAFVDVLGLQHRRCGAVGRLGNHCGERLQIGSAVPLVGASQE